MSKVTNLIGRGKGRANTVLAVVLVQDAIEHAQRVVIEKGNGLSEDEIRDTLAALDKAWMSIMHRRPSMVTG